MLWFLLLLTPKGRDLRICRTLKRESEGSNMLMVMLNGVSCDAPRPLLDEGSALAHYPLIENFESEFIFFDVTSSRLCQQT